ncbi:beta-glucuronidase [Promicromonospora sp. NPDC057488]|uniref:beta-glucuronidase n=1 Tax=Promicromonospora sp. NPDC057488 TaxID=3346147 RepID=UPI00366E8616
MLRPQDNETRERKRLDGIWRFRVDADGAGRHDRWFDGPLEGTRPMAVPASYNDVVVDAAVHDHIGSVWYETDVWVPRGWAGQRTVLYFESATHRATVWVNGIEVVRHEGGYLPFEADISEHVEPGTAARVTVEVDNTLTFQSVPPGVVLDTPHGKRQKYWHDFFNYAGIHRSVWLSSTPAAHLTDLTVVTDLDSAAGVVRYAARTQDAERTRVVAALHDGAGRLVADGAGADGELRVANVRPWRPGEGYLYELRVRLVDDAGVVDEYRQPVGVRTVRVDGTRFLINGEPFYFTGFAMHEDVPVLGKGHHDAFSLHDLELVRWTGGNSIRTSHYPYSEDVLDLADRLGIVVIDETAAVGMNMAIGGGVFGAQGYVTYSEDTINEQTQAVHAAAIEELVARDKNHPSVVLWSIANEPESQTPEAEEYFRPLFELTRRCDPTRPVGFANVVLAPHGECLLSKYSDVLMINRYYGWYLEPGDLEQAEAALEAELRAWASDGKPIIMTEYGSDTMPGLHGTAALPWTEEFQTEFLATYHRVFDRVDAVVGEQVWCFADFVTTPGPMRVGGNRKGVFTRDRQPKAAAYALRARWHGLTTTNGTDA